jgi:hypothetical protein
LPVHLAIIEKWKKKDTRSDERQVFGEGFFSFFSEVNIEPAERQPVASRAKGQPVLNSEHKFPDVTINGQQSPRKNKKSRSPKIAAEKQRERRRAKSEIGLVRVEGYIPRDLGERLAMRAKLSRLSQAEVIRSAIAKFLFTK